MTGQKPARNKPEPLTHATSNLGIWLNLKLVLYLEDLANPKIGLNSIPNSLITIALVAILGQKLDNR
nr:hypothetical protein [uncultured Flavobacterium sp.]